MQYARVAVFALIFTAIWSVCGSDLFAASPEDLVAAIQAVGGEGKGNAEAHRAVEELNRAKADALPVILAGFKDANPLAENWLRGAFEAVADRAIKQGDLPEEAIEKFVRDRKQSPRARRLAFEWLALVDESAADRLVPGMIDDPSADFRRDAVARLIAEAEKFQGEMKNDRAAETYARALAGAVDNDQVQQIVDPLRKFGKKVDLQRQFGFIAKWNLIGPFDNKKGIGFAASYPPEKEIDLTKNYPGQTGDVSWTAIATEDEYGIVDIAKQVGPYKGAVMYAVHEFRSPQRRDVELRLGTPNAWIIWINGKRVFGRQEYHRGMALDQFRVNATLQAGVNTILLKLCQNEMEVDWAQRYQFQLRVCDGAGAAVLSQEGDASAFLDAKRRQVIVIVL